MSGIGLGSIGSSYNQFSPTRPVNQIASGKRINSAADDAAGLAIAKSLENQAAGSTQASNNAKDMINLLNLTDGAKNQVSEGLSRIRELGVQAKNSIYGDAEKAIFQEEINGIKEGINDIAKNTNYNGKTVLDGSFTAQKAAIGPNGESMDINIESSLTDALGISDFDVTGDFNLDSIDKAIEAVGSQSANIGAMTNRLEYSSRVQDNAAYNAEVARSRIEDADIAKASMESSRNNITKEVSISMQKLKMQGMGSFLQLIG